MRRPYRVVEYTTKTRQLYVPQYRWAFIWWPFPVGEQIVVEDSFARAKDYIMRQERERIFKKGKRVIPVEVGE